MSKSRYLRFNEQDRVQHWLLVLSFSLLALTGIVQKYSQAAVSQSIISLMGGIETVRIIHRVSAVVLMMVSVYHVTVVAYHFIVLRKRASMLPGKSDFIDAWIALKFSLGLGKDRPKFDRYSFEEKFEYWAVVWGMGVMIVTGFMLLNPIATTRLLPGEVIPAAKSAHGNEALLAVIAIILWHFYNVLVRHLNKSMFTGYLSREEMEKFHPVELAHIEAGHLRQAPANEVEKRRRIFVPISAVLGVIFLFAIYWFVTFEDSALETITPIEEVASTYPDSPETDSASQTDQDNTQLIEESAAEALALMWPNSPHTFAEAEAFRYWDSAGEVAAACSTCHSSEGLPYYLEHGTSIAQPVSDGLFCTTCHNNTAEYTIFSIDQFTFASGGMVTGDVGEISVCVACHQGTAAGSEVVVAVAGLAPDLVDPGLSFFDAHTAAPGSTFFGAGAMGAYQYGDNAYRGSTHHVADYNECQECHQPHELAINFGACSTCHVELEANQSLRAIRFSVGDFDGDGNVDEGMAEEIDGLHNLLWEAIRAYASEIAGAEIAYNKGIAPYYFIDVNGNGVLDSAERLDENQYANWTPRLLEAAFNYHYVGLDSGGFAHNGIYLLQILYDSLADLGADVSSLNRP